MLSDKIMILNACAYTDLAKNSKVFNTTEIEYHLWIYMNPDDVRDAVFLKGYEVGPDTYENPKIPTSIFTRESECWIRAVTQSLNTQPGKHTYKLMMVDRCTDTDFSLYISYFIQDNNPEKPYVYMHKDATEEDDKTDEDDGKENS